MSTASVSSKTASSATISVALVGNPNTGKSTLFSALAGIHQRVGNYPGVTVDLVVCIVDASNLARNLYLVSQVLELRLPSVLAVNMIDVAKAQGISLDFARLERQLGVPVVPVQANRRIGVEALKAALARRVEHRVESPLPEALLRETIALQPAVAEALGVDAATSPTLPCLAQRLLLDNAGLLERSLLAEREPRLCQALHDARQRLANSPCAVPGVEISARYDWVQSVSEGVVSRSAGRNVSRTDRIDGILTHRLWGTLILAVVMTTVFQAVFVWARPFMEWIDAGVQWMADLIRASLAEGPLQSLLIDGVVRGAGGVLVFLPQIAILFFFIAILEDCGYMARGAFLMDRLMARIGLSGKSFVPMLSSFACAIPGIMATRVIENERDRLTTILVAPLLTCSARLPVYALLISAFIPAQTYWGGLISLQGLTLTGLYLLGIVAAVAVARILKRTLLRGEAPPFLMELPTYKRPSLRTIAMRVLERAWLFVRCAGTLILAVSILTWAALYYPHNPRVVVPLHAQRAEIQSELDGLTATSPRRLEIAAQIAELDRQIQAQQQRHSILGRVGQLIEPAVRPLGWDWRVGCAVLASFPAREVVVATIGVIFNGEEPPEADGGDAPDGRDDATATQFHARLRSATWDDSDRPLFNVPVALSIMVFFALCAQCVATLAVIRRETNSWRWPVFTFAYMTGLAYAGALITYQTAAWCAAAGLSL